MTAHYKPTKGFNYEDDHDYDDTIDYAAQELVYWYGKYYPKEKIDQMFENQGEGSSSGLISKPLLVAIVGGALLLGTIQAGNNYWTHRSYEKKEKKRKQERERKQKAKNL